jgi:hypothetical protein
MRKLKINEFYCVKCRKIVTGSNICVIMYNTAKRKNIPALKATCIKCDTNLTKFISNDNKDKMIEKYGKCKSKSKSKKK